MPISVQLDGRSGAALILDAFREEVANKRFWVYKSTDSSIGISVRFPHGEKPKYDVDEAEILLLLNPFHVEASVMEVTLQPKTIRLGYVFSITSIISKSHAFSNDTHFRKAAYAAVYKLLERYVTKGDKTVILGSCADECEVDELFGGELVILATHKPNTQNAGIQPVQLHADLYRHGYVLADRPLEPSPRRLEVVEANFVEASTAGRLRLRALSAELSADTLLAKIIGTRLSCPDDHVLRFFYLYQAVERLLELEMKHQAKQLLAELSAADPSGTKIVSAFHELKDAFSEKARLRSLFEVRSRSPLQTSPTLNYMVTFLNGCQVDASGNYYEVFYKVRNVVFHTWWSIPEGLSSVFGEVVAGIENDIPELLLNYSPPSPSISEDCEYMI